MVPWVEGEGVVCGIVLAVLGGGVWVVGGCSVVGVVLIMVVSGVVWGRSGGWRIGIGVRVGGVVVTAVPRVVVGGVGIVRHGGRCG